MTALSDHFRCQVLGRTAIGHSLAVFVEKVGPAEVCELHSILGVQQDILRLDVSMNNGRLLRVQILAGFDDLADELGRYSLIEPTFTLKAGVDLALRRELQDQVE